MNLIVPCGPQASYQNAEGVVWEPEDTETDSLAI